MDEEGLLQEPRGRSRAIVSGAAGLLRRSTRISGQLFVGLVLVCCLISVQLALLLLVFTPGIPIAHRSNCSNSRTFDGASVYFVKHRDRSWTRDELCAIETAAHLYPHCNIAVIDLLSDNSTLELPIDDKIGLARRLAEKLSNVKSTDISVREFFAKSVMSKRIQAGDLTNDEIESAAKFQLIWDSPGVSLEPLLVHQLKSVFKDEVELDASVLLDADFQASGVSCQSFIGFVLDRMAKPKLKFTDRRKLVESSLSQYCNRVIRCKGVNIVKPIPRKSFNVSCPIIHSLL